MNCSRSSTSLNTRSAMSRSRSDSSTVLKNADAVGDRQLADLEDVAAADRDRERRGPQPRAAARRARHQPHVALDHVADAIGVALACAGARTHGTTPSYFVAYERWRPYRFL